MFTRSNPAAYLLTFLLVLVSLAAFVALAFLNVGHTPGEDGVPATASDLCTQDALQATPTADVRIIRAQCDTLNAAYTYQYGPGHTVNSAPTIDTADYGTDIPRCASDDWNSTHLARCYTESPTSVIIIDQADNTIATLSK